MNRKSLISINNLKLIVISSFVFFVLSNNVSAYVFNPFKNSILSRLSSGYVWCNYMYLRDAYSPDCEYSIKNKSEVTAKMISDGYKKTANKSILATLEKISESKLSSETKNSNVANIINQYVAGLTPEKETKIIHEYIYGTSTQTSYVPDMYKYVPVTGASGVAGASGADGITTIMYATGTLDVTGLSTLATTTITGAFFGAGLSSCNGLFDKLTYNNTTNQFECAIDQSGAAGSLAFATIGNATITNSTTSNAFISSLITSNATTTNFFATTLRSLTSYFTDIFTTNLQASNTNTNNLISASSTLTGTTTITNASISNFYNLLQNFTTNLFSSATNTIYSTVNGVATSTNIINNNTVSFATTTGVITTNVNGVEATTTLNNLSISSGTISNLYSSNATLTNLINTNATSSNFFATTLRALTSIFTDIFTTNLYATNTSVTNATNTNLVITSIFKLPNVLTSNTNTNILTTDINGVVATRTISSLVASSTTNVLSISTTTNNISLVSNVNGVNSTVNTNLINSNSLSTTTNTLQTIINGVSSFVTNIINSFTQSVTGNVLTSTVNGVIATTTVISSNSLTFSGSIATSTVNGVVATTTLNNLSISSGTISNLYSSNATLTNLINTNATSSNFFTSLINAITATFNTLTGGNITATSSLVSNGTLAVAGNSTLATTTTTRLTTSGFLGVGTSTPTEMLSVAGNVIATGTLSLLGTGTSTFNGGLNLLTGAGCFAINGSCIGGSGGSGLTSLNGSVASTQTFASTTSGTDFSITTSGGVHTFALPDASVSARGVVTTGIQTFAGSKTFSTNPTFSSLTQGSVPFIGTSGVLTQNNTQLFWDNTNNRLGIGTTTPAEALQVVGSIGLSVSGSSASYLNFSSTGTKPTYSEGRLFYDNTEKALSLFNDDSNVTMNLGQENWIRVRNITGSTIANGSAVYINGADGTTGLPTIALAKADSITTSDAVGVTTQSIANNANGYVTAFGVIHVYDTSAFAAGATLYVSAATAGALTSTRPSQPNFTNPIAQVSKVGASGNIFISAQRSRFGAYTTGAVAFGGSDGFIKESASNFFWDSINNRLGIGTTTPGSSLTVAGTALVTGTTTLGAASSQAGVLAFQNAINSFATYLKSSSTQASNLTFTLPGTNGTSGQALTTDGAGGMYWSTISGGAGGGVSLAPTSADVANSANSGIRVNQTGSGNLLQLQQSGLDKFIVANNGGLTINGADSSIVRTSTPEFSLGTVGASLTNLNGRLELSDGTVPNSGKGTITTAGQVTTSAALGAGAFGITRADGMYLIIRGGAGTGMDIYNSVAATTSASAQVLTGVAGAGALALPRPDGRYLVIHGGALTTTTLIDPQGSLAAAAGPAVTASGAGTVAFKRFDGRFLFTNGGAGTTQIYDTVANTFATGPSMTAGVSAAGALVLQRPDGQALMVVGGATGNTQLYNQGSGTGNIGVFSAGPTMGTGCEINGAGSVALKKQDGKYVVLSKVNASTIYDPLANTFTCSTSNGPATALGDGAHAIPLQNGNFLIVVGGGSTASYVYDSVNNTYTAQGTATTAITTGAFSLMNYDGTWQVFVGGGTASNKYDTGLTMTGTTALYTSEDIASTALNARSVFKWTAQFETPYVGTNSTINSAFSTLQFLVRTGTSTAALAYATDREISSSGSLVGASSTDQAIKVKIQFNRPIPKRIVDERGTWTGNGSSVNRLDYQTPAVFDYSIDNSVALHRSAADFGLPNAALNGAQTETSGPTMTRVEPSAAGLQLPYGRITPTTVAGTNGYYMGLVSAAHPNLPQAQTNEGTIVIVRPNKTFIIIASLNTPAANAALYDPATQTFTAQSGASIPTAPNGGGGFALKRPDGKFLVVMGSSTAVTNIYNADTNTFSAGPILSGVAALGASAIPNTDGTFTIVHGGALTTSSLYDPVRNTMIAGPVLTTAANCGFFAIPLQNGTYKTSVGVAPGVAGATTAMVYNPAAKSFSAGTAFTTAHGCGAFAFQKSDGQWLSITAQSGAAGIPANSTNIINAVNGTTIAGPALSAVASRGAHMIPRADGTFLIIHASSSVTLSTIYDPNGSTFAVGTQLGSTVSGPSTLIGQGVGAISFQRPDGKWVMINGSSTASVLTYDAGWYAEGQYLSEQMNVPALAANSTLEWKQAPDNFVRMEIRASTTQSGLSSTGYNTIGISGSSINNAGGETWVQVVVNFRRDFPTFGGALSGVYNTGGGMVYPYRTISLPTVSEYKVNNGMDLLTLQDNGLNVMRVTTSGNVYTGASGGFYSGGADLAERYTSTDYLEAGDVVVSDYMNNHGVKKSTGAYQEGMLGVVSTAPGFIAGAFTEDSYPIGLVGRVPVKVSTENGPVRAGDYLTSASIPGYAMKATYAGRVIGKAMEDLTEGNMKVCPGVAAGLRENVKCGVVMMFVNLVDYKGGSIQVAMDEWSSNHSDTTALYNETGLSVAGVEGYGVTANGATSTLGFNSIATTHDTEVLAFLKKIKEENEANLNGQSDIFAQNVHVISEVIAPKIITDILAAREAHITNIEGFRISAEVIIAKKVVTDALVSTTGDIGFRFTADGRMVMFSKSTSTVATATSTDEFASSTDNIASTTATTTEVSIFGPDEVIAFDMKGNAFFAGEIVAKEVKTESLSVSGQAVLRGGLLVNTIGTDNSVLALLGDVEFFGRPYFNHDMGGTAIIKKGAKSVEIIFDKEYIESPSVVASISFSDEATSTLEIRELAAFDESLKFIVTKRNTKGFTILLNKAPNEDITFMWMALAIKDAKVFTSLEVATSTAENINTFTTEGDTSTTTESNITSTTTDEIIPDINTTTDTTSSTTENNTTNTPSEIPVNGQ